MKTARFADAQIIAVLKEGDAGTKRSELCRKNAISDIP
jgi:hypothetical protein